MTGRVAPSPVSRYPAGMATEMILRQERGTSPPAQLDDVRPPAHLSPVAVELWNELVVVLCETGMMTVADTLPFGQLCEAYADYCSARQTLADNGGNYYREERLARDGSVIGRGPWRLHPAFYALSDADRRIRGWCQEFQLSPSARLKFMSRQPTARLPGEPEDEIVDLDELSPDERAALETILEKNQVAQQMAREEA